MRVAVYRCDGKFMLLWMAVTHLARWVSAYNGALGNLLVITVQRSEISACY